jgi:hypothetical protein
MEDFSIVILHTDEMASLNSPRFKSTPSTRNGCVPFKGRA